jgi:uncharacterized protein involved in exopolysaccharide biosynthesis
MRQTLWHDQAGTGREEKGARGVMQDEQDNEIDLREYINVAIKRKKIILVICLTSMLAAVIWGFFSPRIYEVSMIIEPPISAITDTGVQAWDTGVNIKAKIEAGAYNDAIIDDVSPLEVLPQFVVSIPKETRLLKISLRGTANETAYSKKILSKLFDGINVGYAKVIEDKRNKIENDIKIVQSQIATKENEIRLKNEQFKILEAREHQFIEDIKEVRANSEKLLAKRESVFERKENKDDVAALFYAATIQQNVSYLTQLQNDLADLRNKKESVINGVENLKNSINESRIGIRNLNLLKGGVQNIQVIQEPFRSLQPVGPNRRQNTFIAGAIGLMVGLFLAFFIEYRENFSRRS